MVPFTKHEFVHSGKSHGGKSHVGNLTGQTFSVVDHQVCTQFRSDFDLLLSKSLEVDVWQFKLSVPPHNFYWINVWRLLRPRQDINVFPL